VARSSHTSQNRETFAASPCGGLHIEHLDSEDSFCIRTPPSRIPNELVGPSSDPGTTPDVGMRTIPAWRKGSATDQQQEHREKASLGRASSIHEQLTSDQCLDDMTMSACCVALELRQHMVECGNSSVRVRIMDPLWFPGGDTSGADDGAVNLPHPISFSSGPVFVPVHHLEPEHWTVTRLVNMGTFTQATFWDTSRSATRAKSWSARLSRWMQSQTAWPSKVVFDVPVSQTPTPPLPPWQVKKSP
jgi:hypothetical protein